MNMGQAPGLYHGPTPSVLVMSHVCTNDCAPLQSFISSLRLERDLDELSGSPMSRSL